MHKPKKWNMEMNKQKMTTLPTIKIKRIRQKLELYIEQYTIKHLFQAVFFVRRIHFVADKVSLLYVLLRLNEKPTINFLKPAAIQKMRLRGEFRVSEQSSVLWAYWYTQSKDFNNNAVTRKNCTVRTLFCWCFFSFDHIIIIIWF